MITLVATQPMRIIAFVSGSWTLGYSYTKYGQNIDKVGSVS
jgi:hypothetical protein